MLSVAPFLFLVGFCVAQDGAIVETNYGTLQGASRVYRDGRAYEEYLGIPFASPPLGEQRWRRADPPRAWNGTRDATAYDAHCTSILAQFYGLVGWDVNVSEDCLYLNVVVPGSVDSIETPLPVIVFVTGGAWLIGTAEFYPGMKLALDGEVIVVTINYRVGVLGFLTTEDENAPGNSALWDDIMALQWVRDNIHHFGGDADRVTLVGQSAGGASVSHLANSPEAQGLFARVAALSGSSTALWSWTRLGYSSARDLAIANLCPILNNRRMVNCLREVGADYLDIVGLITPFVFDQLTPITAWAPIIDGAVIPEDPRVLVQEGAPAAYDLLTGYTHHDAAGFVYVNFLGIPGLENILNVAATQELLDSTLQLMFSYFGNPDELIAEIKLRYPDLDNEDVELRTKALTRMETDYLFGSTSTFAAEHHSRLSVDTSTYAYDFSYRQSFLGYADWVNGSHVDDLFSLFGEPFLERIREVVHRKNFSDADREMSLRVIHYYSNFAYSGDPNSGPHQVDVEWPEFDEAQRQYLVFGPDTAVTEQDEDMQERFYWWSYVFPELTVPRSSRLRLHSLASIRKRLDLSLKFLRKLSDAYPDFGYKSDMDALVRGTFERLIEALQ